MAFEHGDAKHDGLLEIGRYVRERYKEAFEYRHNSGEYERMVNCVKQMKGEPLTCDTDADGMPNLTMNLSKAIARGVAAMMKKPLDKVNGAPFVVKTTPLAELSAESNRKVMEDIMANADVLTNIAEVSPEVMQETVAGMKESARVAERQESEKAAKKMQEKIKDTTVEGGLMKALSEFMDTLSEQPFAVMKMEYINVKQAKWTGARVEVIEEPKLTFKNLNPFDFYPAPKTLTVGAKTATIEKRTVLRTDLVTIAQGGDDYFPQAVAKVLEEYPTGHHEPYCTNMGEGGKRDEGTYGMYDCLIMYDYMLGSYLSGLGIDVENTDDAYDVEVWVIGNWPIKIAFNTDMMGDRPYFGTSFTKARDSVYGDSPITDMYQMQMVLNHLLKSLVRNVGLTSGFIGEVDADRLPDDDQESSKDDKDDITRLFPNQIVKVKADRYHGQTAYRFYTLPYIAGQIQSLIESFTQYVYQIIGIPSYAFGQTQGMGTVGRTSGGVAMMMNQAVNAIWVALHNIEADVIEPIINKLILDELVNGDDETIKGDVKAYALALSGLAEDDSKTENLVWLVQSLSAVMGQTYPDGTPILPPDALAKLFYRMFKDFGINTDGIFPNFDLQESLKSDTAQQSAPVAATPTPDGRTGDLAAGVLSNQ